MEKKFSEYLNEGWQSKFKKNMYKGLSESDLITILESKDRIIYQLLAYTNDKKWQGQQLEKKLRKLIDDLEKQM